MKRKNWLLALGVAAVIVAGSALILTAQSRQPGAQTEAKPPVAAEEAAAADAPEKSSETVQTKTSGKSSPYTERALGNPDAPVTIREFASLTCSHCAHFHQETFGKLKERYIDTGKVRFIYNDFPLNAPALDAAMVARCLPEEQYFMFVKFLFENQKDWAFSRTYRDNLRQNAKLLGMSDATFDSCLADEKLKAELADRMQKNAEKYDIKATPTFVINEKEVVAGFQTVESFGKAIDKLLAQEGGASQ